MNKITLIGRLTTDLSLRYVPTTGKAVANFTLAVPRKYDRDKADFLRCTIFGKGAEILAEHTVKGHRLAIDGSVQTGSYQASDGTTKYTCDVIVDNFTFLEGKKDSKK